MPTDVWAEAGAVLFEALVAIACLWLVFNAARHLFVWLWHTVTRGAPPKPDLGPYAGPTVIAEGNWVRSGQAWKAKHGRGYNEGSKP